MVLYIFLSRNGRDVNKTNLILLRVNGSNLLKKKINIAYSYTRISGSQFNACISCSLLLKINLFRFLLLGYSLQHLFRTCVNYIRTQQRKRRNNITLHGSTQSDHLSINMLYTTIDWYLQ